MMYASIFNRRYASNMTNDVLWNQWLAGLIDGDGCFFISKQGQISLEITVACDDAVMLQQIKQKTGGVVKLRSGSKSVRLRIFRKQQLIDVIHRVNGHIRLEVRQQQLKKVCSRLNLVFLQPSSLVLPNGYIAGLFDADGSVTIGVQRAKSVNSIKPGLNGKIIRLTEARGFHQLSLHIVNLDYNLLLQVQQCLGFGQLISEQMGAKRVNKLTRFYFRSYDHVMRWLIYVKSAPLRSQKQSRCNLLKTYFELKFNKAHLATCGPQYKLWQTFCKKWFNTI